MDAFTSAGLRRIAVACGATDEDVATGDPAGALVSRWLQVPVDDWFKDLRGGWLGLEDTGPLPFIRFAGFVEAGTRFGYLDLSSFPARDELRLALERWNLGDNAHGRAGLAVSLRERLAAEAQSLSELRESAGVAAFESYIRLDETVRRDLDLREFLAVCHSGRPHAKTDAIFLANPEFFAEALACRCVRRLPVGGQVSGGLEAARALERLSRLLGGLGQRERLRETLILHARWAHQIDKVFDRLEQWIIRAREWNSDADIADDYSSEWPVYLARTVVPLADQQRSLGLLASPDWHPRKWRDSTLFVDPEGASPSDVEDAIRNLSEQADDAVSEGYANEALSRYAEAARLRAEHINYEVAGEVLSYWELIENVLRLGDRDTAAALCAVAYPALRHALITRDHRLHLTEAEVLEELMESLRRPRSAGQPGTASGASDAPPASSDAGTIQQPFGSGQASSKEAPPRARSYAVALVERLRAAQQVGSLGARAPSDVSAVRYALETKTAKDPAALLTSVRQALPGLAITVERVFAQATDEELARFFHLEIIGITWDAVAASPFDLAYYLENELDLASCEPRLDSTFPVEPATVHEGPVVESAIIDWFGCFKDERVRPGQVDKDVLWALGKMHVPEAWAFSEREARPDRGAGIIIAQPDTGIAEHEELGDGALDFTRAFNIFTGERNVRDPLIKQDPLDQPGHGTGTSSVAISREGLLIAGSAPKATLVPIRCIESVIRFDQVPVAQAIDHARRSGCHVITMSLGGIPSLSLRAALRRAVEDNLIVMAAAGNCVKLVVWPARYEDCIAVAGTTFDDERWIGSCRGDAVDISAPGEFVWRAKRENGDTEFNIIWPGQGTSFAVALTAGVAALWLAHFGRDNLIARLTPGETLQARFRRMLMASARRVPQLDDDGMGAGVVDARALLELDPFVAPAAVIETAIAEAPTRASSIRSFVAEIAPRPVAEATAGAPIDDASLVRYGQEIAWRALKRRTQAARGGVAVEAAAVSPPRSAELSRFVAERAPWLETSI